MVLVVSTRNALAALIAKERGGSTDLKWIYISLGLSNSQWLWKAVTSIP
jgi:hypothetical protein